VPKAGAAASRVALAACGDGGRIDLYAELGGAVALSLDIGRERAGGAGDQRWEDE